MIVVPAISLESPDPQQILGTPIGLIGLIIGLFSIAVAILQTQVDRFLLWLAWGILTATTGFYLLKLSHDIGDNAQHARLVGATLLFVGSINVIYCTFKKFAKNAPLVLRVLILLVVLFAFGAYAFRSLTKPNYPSRNPSQSQVSLLLREARTLFGQGKYRESIAILKKIVSIDKSCIEAHVLLTRAYIRLPTPDCESALQHFVVLPPDEKFAIQIEYEPCRRKL